MQDMIEKLISALNCTNILSMTTGFNVFADCSGALFVKQNLKTMAFQSCY